MEKPFILNLSLLEIGPNPKSESPEHPPMDYEFMIFPSKKHSYDSYRTFWTTRVNGIRDIYME